MCVCADVYVSMDVCVCGCVCEHGCVYVCAYDPYTDCYNTSTHLVTEPAEVSSCFLSRVCSCCCASVITSSPLSPPCAN